MDNERRCLHCEESIEHMRKNAKYCSVNCSNKAYYQLNKDVIIERSRKHYAANREHVAVYKKKYNVDNRESIRECKKVYYENNKDHLKAYATQWGKDNPDKVKGYRKTLYAKQVSENESHVYDSNNDARFEGNRDVALERDNHTCQMYGCVHSLLVHHRNQDKKDNRLRNLITLCRSCHVKLHLTTIDLDFVAQWEHLLKIGPKEG